MRGTETSAPVPSETAGLDQIILSGLARARSGGGSFPAQFSGLSFEAVGDGECTVRLGPAPLRDPLVGGFAARQVTVRPTDEVDFLAMAPVTAHVRLKDGRRITFVGETVPGSLKDRLTLDQLKAKAADCLEKGGSGITADQLWTAVRALADDVPVSDLLQLLGPPLHPHVRSVQRHESAREDR